MNFRLKIHKYSIGIILISMLFSCTNNVKEVKGLLANENKPIGVAENIVHVYKDSGNVTNRLKTSVLNDFSNRKEHPYSEFPKGLEILNISKNKKDTILIKGNYALTYSKTSVSEIKGDVVIINCGKKVKLETNQLFWDQKEKYFFTEDGFRLTTPKDTINGFGFESRQDLSKWIAKDITGKFSVDDKKM